jgi:hypothetical protein
MRIIKLSNFLLTFFLALGIIDKRLRKRSREIYAQGQQTSGLERKNSP